MNSKLSVLDNMIDEISSFLNVNKEEVKEKIEDEIFNQGKNVANDWNRFNPKTEEEVINFYKKTNSYIYDLYVDHMRSSRRNLSEKIVKLLNEYNVSKILDYGGGIGFDSIEMAKGGFDVTYYEPESKTSEFAKWRFNKYGLNKIKIVHDIDKLKTNDFDCIVCIEVLEHLPEPEKIIKSFNSLTTKEGMVLMTESFEMTGENYPSHLVQNRKYIGKIYSIMSKNGFVCLKLDSDNLKVFRKMEKGLKFMLFNMRRRMNEFKILAGKLKRKINRIR